MIFGQPTDKLKAEDTITIPWVPDIASDDQPWK